MSESVLNPRFPHSLIVKRPSVDSDGVPITDSDGNITEQTILESKFGYRTQTMNTSSAGDVIKADYKLSLPRTTANVIANDKLYITDYTRSFVATVLKFNTFNLGSNIWANEIKN